MLKKGLFIYKLKMNLLSSIYSINKQPYPERALGLSREIQSDAKFINVRTNIVGVLHGGSLIPRPFLSLLKIFDFCYMLNVFGNVYWH